MSLSESAHSENEQERQHEKEVRKKSRLEALRRISERVQKIRTGELRPHTIVERIGHGNYLSWISLDPDE